MRFAIMESVVTPGGHEIDFDRLLVEELTALGHSVEFYVPEGHEFKWNYGVPVHHLPGTGVSYKGAKGIKKLFLSVKREWHRQKWYQNMYVNACQNKFDVIIFPSATYRYLRALKKSALQHSPVPVLFLIHGATPEEALRLNKVALYFKHNKNIRVGVQTFAPKKLRLSSPNIKVYGPPNRVARLLCSGKIAVSNSIKSKEERFACFGIKAEGNGDRRDCIYIGHFMCKQLTFHLGIMFLSLVSTPGRIHKGTYGVDAIVVFHFFEHIVIVIGKGPWGVPLRKGFCIFIIIPGMRITSILCRDDSEMGQYFLLQKIPVNYCGITDDAVLMPGKIPVGICAGIIPWTILRIEQG